MKNTLSRLRSTARAHLVFSLCLCGVLGGFINGLLGAGSGIIFIFVLSFLFSGEGEKDERDIFSLSLGAVFFVTLFSVFFYAIDGKVDFAAASSYIMPAIAGGLAGAFLLGKINTLLLKVIFSAIVIFSGLSML